MTTTPRPPAAQAVHDTPASETPILQPPTDAGRRDDPRSIVSIRGGHFRAYWDDHIVGDHDCYHDADTALDDHERGLFESGLLDAPPAVIYARPADLAEFAPTWIGMPTPDTYPCPCLALTCETCLQAKPESAFVATLAAPLSSPVVCDAWLAPSATSADPDARVAATPQPLARTERHDLRFPAGAFNRDAWVCGDGHVFWVEVDHAPLTCPRCDTLAAVEPDAGGESLMACYHDDPVSFLARFDGWDHRVQAAVTRAAAAFLGESVGSVDQLWVDSREKIARMGSLS